MIAVDAAKALPSRGRTGRPPKCPYDLATAGDRWWRWAWCTPQATRWDNGALYSVARRAQLEDVAAALVFEDLLNLDDLLAGADPGAVARVTWALTMLKQAASGDLAVKKEMRELDSRLGLNPQGMVALGWVIAGDVEKKDGLDDLTAKRSARLAANGD